MAIIEIYQDRTDILRWEYIDGRVHLGERTLFAPVICKWLVNNNILVRVVTSNEQDSKTGGYITKDNFGYGYIWSEMMYKNTEKYGFTGYNDGYTYLYFENDDGAMAFKLAWM